MAFQRFSLRGFESEFNIRRRIEIYNGRLLIWATLYRGWNWRRKIDMISTGCEIEDGRDYAEALGWELRNRLVEKHGLSEGHPLQSAH